MLCHSSACRTIHNTHSCSSSNACSSFHSDDPSACHTMLIMTPSSLKHAHCQFHTSNCTTPCCLPAAISNKPHQLHSNGNDTNNYSASRSLKSPHSYQPTRSLPLLYAVVSCHVPSHPQYHAFY